MNKKIIVMTRKTHLPFLPYIGMEFLIRSGDEYDPTYTVDDVYWDDDYKTLEVYFTDVIMDSREEMTDYISDLENHGWKQGI
jgi:hypothetical protein